MCPGPSTPSSGRSPRAPAAPVGDTAKLADLKALFDAGALTQEEFDEAKKEVIAASRNSSPVLDRQPDRRSEHGEPVFSPVGGLPTTGAPWTEKEGACDACFYSTCNSADDFNLIAEHLGLSDRVNCLTIYCARVWGVCGGICWLGSQAQKLKSKYAEAYGLQQEDISCIFLNCFPEAVFLQIKREHLADTGKPMTTVPYTTDMARR